MLTLNFRSRPVFVESQSTRTRNCASLTDLITYRRLNIGKDLFQYRQIVLLKHLLQILFLHQECKEPRLADFHLIRLFKPSFGVLAFFAFSSSPFLSAALSACLFASYVFCIAAFSSCVPALYFGSLSK
jgi:hypothetical protein